MKFKFLPGCLAAFSALTVCPSAFLDAALHPSAPSPHFAQISKNAQKALENITQESHSLTLENAKNVAKYAAPVAALGLLIKYPAITRYAFDKTIQAANTTYKSVVNSAIYVKNELPKIFQVRQPQDYPEGQPAAPEINPDLARRQQLARYDNCKYLLYTTGALATAALLNWFIREEK